MIRMDGGKNPIAQTLEQEHLADRTPVTEETFLMLPLALRHFYADRARRGERPPTELAARCLLFEVCQFAAFKGTQPRSAHGVKCAGRGGRRPVTLERERAGSAA